MAVESSVPEITTFYFYLRFPYCPNFSDLGLYTRDVMISKSLQYDIAM